jgi:cytochrome c553
MPLFVSLSCSTVVAVVGLGAALLIGTPALAQDARAGAGRVKAQACNACHGANGMSVQPDAPHLAGQPAFYLSTQLKAYRTGERRHEVMGVMAKTLSDEDIDALSAWFASIKIEVKPPR